MLLMLVLLGLCAVLFGGFMLVSEIMTMVEMYQTIDDPGSMGLWWLSVVWLSVVMAIGIRVFWVGVGILWEQL